MNRPGVRVDGSVVECQSRQFKLTLFLVLLDQQPTTRDGVSCRYSTATDAIKNGSLTQQIAPDSSLLDPDGDLGASSVDNVGCRV